MKCPGVVQICVLLSTSVWVSSMPTKESTTRRPQFGETIKHVTIDATSSPDLFLDVRTPPKVKQHIKKPPRKEVEIYHPGVAVPVEDADAILEEHTKTFNFYKLENKPTTDRGLSTWVLLSSHTVAPPLTTTKTTRSPTTKHHEKNLTAIDAEIFNKMTKPLFKKRPGQTTTSTTKKPATGTTAKIQKLTKVKASVLTNAINNKNKTDANNPSSTPEEISTMSLESTTISIKDNELIPDGIEAKDGELELVTTVSTQTSKKTKRPTIKRKKNKKRRRPNLDNADNSTKLSNHKEKPISTQIYNYLSREIMPTVGVGLVGLVVTAGLASYFLYPFGGLRRSYDIDRKDKEGSYYYNEEYPPGGVAEEEVIGKVIAGMPTNNNYRTPTSRDAYSSFRYKKTQDPIYLTPDKKYNEAGQNFYNNYNQDIIERNPETGYTVTNDNPFVVGDVQEVTPVVVPEHGPRNLPEFTTNIIPEQAAVEIFSKSNLNSRKRRDVAVEENEIPYDDNTDTSETTSTTEETTIVVQQSYSLMNYLKMFLENKIRMGLELLQTTSRAFSRYLAEVERRFNANTNMNGKEQPRMSW